MPGPIFKNLVLADEVNRTPPKTQAALLQAMQERRVTVGTATTALPDPFQVFATRNPIETEGTYPLPEAQLDRFLLEVHVEYPSEAEEWEIARRTTSGCRARARIGRGFGAGSCLRGARAHASRSPTKPCASLWRVRALSRPGSPFAPPEVNQYVRFGAVRAAARRWFWPPGARCAARRSRGGHRRRAANFATRVRQSARARLSRRCGRRARSSDVGGRYRKECKS